MTAQVADDLAKAVDIIETSGWAQGTYHDECGGHCALGAIALAVGQHAQMSDDLSGSQWWSVLSAGWLAREMDSEVGLRRIACEKALSEVVLDEVTSWNDQADRTAAEVVAALRAAAALAANQ